MTRRRLGRIGRRPALVVGAVVLIVLMVGTAAAAMLAGLLGGGGEGPATQTPCGSWLQSNFSVTLVPGYPGVVAFMEADRGPAGVSVRVTVLNNGTSVAEMEWLKDGVRVELYDKYGVRLGAATVELDKTVLTPGEFVSGSVTFRLTGTLAEPAYVLALQPSAPLFLAQWLLDPTMEAGGCGYYVANYTWGYSAYRWIALEKGLIVVEAVAVPGKGQHEVSAESPEEPFLEFTVYDVSGAPILNVKSARLDSPARIVGGEVLVLLAAAASQLDQPDFVKIVSRLSIDGIELEGFEGEFSEAPWPGDFPGSWVRGTIEVEGENVTLFIVYAYNGFIFVVKNATIIPDGEATVKVPSDFQSSPFIGIIPSPGAIVEVKAGDSTIAIARFFSPEYQGESIRYKGAETMDDGSVIHIYVINGTVQLVNLSGQYGIRSFAVLAAPYGLADKIVVQTPWGTEEVPISAIAPRA